MPRSKPPRKPYSKPKVNMQMNAQSKQLTTLANQVGRSTIAVIDAVTQRGGFRGEELLTIGTLREQCVQIVQLYEAAQLAENPPPVE